MTDSEPTRSSAIAPIKLGDFTTTWRVIPISLLAIVIGVIASVVAYALLELIALFTNLFFFQKFSFAAASPADNTLGALGIAVPIIGALVIGLMARYGSERIRGHGIPEALEAILVGGSRIVPKVAVLKPLSSAISIGSGGPFGAEGPIIMTGGAFGSLVAQLFALTSVERKTLLVAGAAAGMSATFAAPIAAILLAVELLLFEWKPRSFVPVALASTTAAIARRFILGPGPLFPVAWAGYPTLDALACCAAAGLFAGGLSALLTGAVYAFEDLFKRLPIHWMWWPALGGLAIGIGGLIAPHALGVGYDTITNLLHEGMLPKAILVLVIVKSLIWSISLGSGTSGGVLAPLMIMGAALGGIEAHIFPDVGVGFWPLVSLGAIIGGTMRSPFTGVVFAIELTHDLDMAVPLMIAVAISHAFTVLVLRRSILTEKVARRGFHVSREYAIDELEILFARDAMNPDPVVLTSNQTVKEALEIVSEPHDDRSQRLYPILDPDANLVGAISYRDLAPLGDDLARVDTPLAAVAKPFHQLFSNETLQLAVRRMAEHGVTRLLVVNPSDARKLVGKLALHDILAARTRHLLDERRRERILPFEYILPRWLRPRPKTNGT